MRAVALLLCLVASNAFAMEHLFRYTTQPGDPPVAIVGVLSDGVPVTSFPMPAAPNESGVWEAVSHTFYGHETTLVLIGADGQVSAPSNVQVYEGCWWDKSGGQGVLGAGLGAPDGVVGVVDLSEYLLETGRGTATAAEEASFRRAFGMKCP